MHILNDLIYAINLIRAPKQEAVIAKAKQTFEFLAFALAGVNGESMPTIERWSHRHHDEHPVDAPFVCYHAEHRPHALPREIGECATQVADVELFDLVQKHHGHMNNEDHGDRDKLGRGHIGESVQFMISCCGLLFDGGDEIDAPTLSEEQVLYRSSGVNFISFPSIYHIGTTSGVQCVT